MTMEAAPLVEIFASYQGEGPWAGAPQAFVRFGGCNLRCAFCDTPEGIVSPAAYRVETAPFRGAFEARPNPCGLEACVEHLERMARSPIPLHAVAFTGGEPLLHAGFLAALLPRARRLFPRTYLDTNATLPRALEKVVGFIDIVSLGVKLPSSSGVRAAWAQVAACLRIAAGGGGADPPSPAGPSRSGGLRRTPASARAPAGGREVFLKVVVTRESTTREVGRAAALAAVARPGMTMVLQPVTPVPGGPCPPDAERIGALLAAAAAHLRDVRVLPQVPPAFGWK